MLALCGFAQRNFDYKQIKIMKHSYMGKKLTTAEKLKHADKRRRSLEKPRHQLTKRSVNVMSKQGTHFKIWVGVSISVRVHVTFFP
jgi:hypothetical protein